MEAAGTSVTSVHFYQTIRHHVPVHINVRNDANSTNHDRRRRSLTIFSRRSVLTGCFKRTVHHYYQCVRHSFRYLSNYSGREVRVLYYTCALQTERAGNSGAFVSRDSMLTDELLLLKSLGNEIWKIQSTKEGGFTGRGKGLINKTKKIYIYEREGEREPLPTHFLSPLPPRKNPCIYR